MGIIVNQSLKNTFFTYLGFAFGAINALFLYTNFLTEEYYGLVTYLLSAANIVMPLLTFGVHNSFIKFFSTYKEGKEQQGFVSFMLLLPLAIIIPVGLIGILFYSGITQWLSKENTLVEGYVWTIYAIAAAIAYFEVFFAWSKVHMRTVFGNFLKEVFHRVVVMVLLFLVYMEYMDANQFILATVVMYAVRTVLMFLVTLSTSKPRFKWALPSNSKSILKYTALIILAGSVANVLLEVDKFMIGQYLILENVAFYSVAIFIVMVITVPSRSMHQITYPITAKLMNERKMKELGELYKKSSLTLFIIGGAIFLLIALNIGELYKIVPAEYGGKEAIMVVFLVGLAKLSDTLLGNNNSIIFNSDYYRMMLLFGVLLAVLTVILNMIYIPIWGIRGAAFASLMAFLIYNSLKIWFVYKKFGMHPFSGGSLKTAGLLLFVFGIFYFWNFPFHPLVNIGLKSLLIGGSYVLAVHRLAISEDISVLISRFIK